VKPNFAWYLKKNKILKKIIFSTKDINQKKLEKNFKNLKIDYKK
jgi:type III pantothenate kinase